MESQTLMIIMGGPGTGKSIKVKATTKILNETVQNSTLVICLGTTGAANFVKSGATCHSVLILQINQHFQDLKGVKLKFPQYHLD